MRKNLYLQKIVPQTQKNACMLRKYVEIVRKRRRTCTISERTWAGAKEHKKSDHGEKISQKHAKDARKKILIPQISNINAVEKKT